MSKAILTTAQSRLTLQIVLFIISGVALASSISKAGSGGTQMLSGHPGDIRGVNSILGGAGLVLACSARIALLCVPLSWHGHVNRLEFGLVSVLWIAWTSATMAFSAFTLARGVCDWAAYPFPLPTCSILTFDLVLVHLASLTTLTLLLVILSVALQPASEESETKDDVWVMWDLALHDHEDHFEQTSSTLQQSSYGTQQPLVTPPPKIDKFEKGRLWTYGCLSLCSLVSFVTALAAALTGGEQVPSAYLLEIVASLSLVFSVYHLLPRSPESNTRHRRMLEVAAGSLFFLLWPIAAITYTLFPAISNRPCAANAVEGDLPTNNEDVITTCMLSCATVIAAWFASWLLFARLLGLVFPMPQVLAVASGERAPLLLAGADFELGDDEETEVRLLAR